MQRIEPRAKCSQCKRESALSRMAGDLCISCHKVFRRVDRSRIALGIKKWAHERERMGITDERR